MEIDENAVRIDRYGPLNVYNPQRANMYNPGGILSIYNEDGTPRTEEELDEVGDEFDRFQEDRLRHLLRRSPRLMNKRLPPEQQIVPFATDIDCKGIDPILLVPVKQGIRLEADNRCYNISSISTYYLDNPDLTPFRNEYTERDKQKIESYLNLIRRGGKRYKSGRKKNNKKTQKKRKNKKRTNRNKRK